MSNGLQSAWIDKVTDTGATQLHPVGTRRFENGREYIYQQADDTIAVNSLVKLDAAASATGLKVTPTGAAVGDSAFGVAEVAVTDEHYFWCTVRGVASCLVANGVAVDDPLGSGGAAGTAYKVVEVDSAGAYNFVRAVALEANASGGALAKNVYLL